MAVAIAGLYGISRPVPAADTADEIKALREQIQKLDEQVRVLERKAEIEKEAADQKARSAPVVTAGADGFAIKSADDNFKLKLRGYIQADGRFCPGDSRHAFTDTFLLNRVRPVFEGTVFKNYDFKLMPDFGQGKAVIQEAFLDAHVLPELSVRIGKYKGPVGLERLQSARDLVFVERALPTDLVPNRDIGAAMHGEFLDGVSGYEVGVFNGAADGAVDDAGESDSKDLAGRVFVHPFKKSNLAPLHGLGLGVAGTTGHENGTAPAYKTVGQQTFFSFTSGVTANGNRNRISPQGYYSWGPFGLLGEYVVSSQDVNKGTLAERLQNSAWQVAASYWLTGEKAAYGDIAPTRPFHLRKGQWGAFQLAARISQLSVDRAAFHNFGTAVKPNTFAGPTKSASGVTSWGVGLNWYLNKDVKFVTDYERAHFDGGASGGDRREEQVIFTRVQVSF